LESSSFGRTEADGKDWLVWLLGYSLKEETSKEEEEDVLWFAIP
jgi:hypothetical protein